MKIMRKIFLIIIFSFITFFSFNNMAEAKKVNVYMFYGKTCPHCEEATEYLNSIKDKYDLNIIKYEVWYDANNRDIMNEVAVYLDVNPTGVPFVIIDNTPIFGYSSKVTDETYLYHIKLASKGNFVDEVGIKLGLVEKNANNIKENTKENDSNYIIDVPILKEINFKNKSMLLSSILLAIIDGFNLCAIWILLYLISILIGIKDNKKIYILEFTFIIFSSIIYLIFMMFNISSIKLIDFISIIKVVLALTSIIVGAFKLNTFANLINEEDKKENKVIKKIKDIINKNKFILLIIGIILLSIPLALIRIFYFNETESLFISLLSLNNLTGINYYLYIIVYIIIFMIINLIIISILNVLTKLFKNNIKYNYLLSGIILFILAMLLLINPQWLMFDF